MNCQRCNGMLVEETWYDYVDSFDGVRCLTCGDISDPLILAHRAEVRPAPFKLDIGMMLPVPVHVRK